MILFTLNIWCPDIKYLVPIIRCMGRFFEEVETIYFEKFVTAPVSDAGFFCEACL